MDINIKEAQESDFIFFEKWFNDSENSQWLMSIYRLGRYNEIIHAISLKKSNNFFNIIYDASKPIGFVGISLIDYLDKTGMIWYVLGDKFYVNKGVTTLAVNLILKKAFNDLKLHSIQACVAEDNKASIRVLEKNNFKVVGVQRESHSMENKFMNKIWFDILATEFEDEFEIYERYKMTEENQQTIDEKERITRIIKDLKQVDNVSEDINFLSDGFLDSFDVINLIDCLEKEFEITIEGKEIISENFNKIEQIVSLVKKIKNQG